MRKLMSLLSLMILIISLSQCSNSSNKKHPTSTDENPPATEDCVTDPNERIVSRTSGVAPLAVHFFSDFVDSASDDERSDRFHHYDYTWNFGDTASGTWGTTGKSKNSAKGAAAVHIFDNPGNYTVTLTISDHSGEVDTETYCIEVSDPDTVYSGTKTTCVNPSGDTNFIGAPSGARTVSTNNLSTIVQYATAGSRILFKRGCSWSAAGLTWPDNAGPVTIGAYGPGTGADAQGIYGNAPEITVTGGSFLPLNYKQDWIVMDLHLKDSTRTFTGISGIVNMQKLLIYRMKIEGFISGVTWSHANDADLMQKDDIVVASCDISEAENYDVYGGSERLAILGNRLYNTRHYHVVRVWQAYRSVISNNTMSGGDYNTPDGLGALKFHGPGVYPGGEGTDTYGEPVEGTPLKNKRTEYTIISDNVFGTSGPEPIAIGPQNGYADERISNIIFERNLYSADYGTETPRPVTSCLMVHSTYTTVRNNLFISTGAGTDCGGMTVGQLRVEPSPTGIEIYNNTFYRGDSGNQQRAILIQSTVSASIVKNNIASYPNVSGITVFMQDYSADLDSSNNLLTTNAYFINPDDADPLARNFGLQSSSPAIGQGTTVPVYDDYADNPRPVSSCDLGAIEQ